MAYEKLSPAEELKLLIIENYIDWCTDDDKQREALKENAFTYVIEDHVNELSNLLSTERPITNW